MKSLLQNNDTEMYSMHNERKSPNLSQEVFVIKKVKNTLPCTYVINDLNREEIARAFYEKELLKTNPK